MPKPIILSILIITCIFQYGCNSSEKPNKKVKAVAKARIDFSPYKGIRYHEVKRRFSNGLSFDTIGFQQEPSWIIQFESKDSILAYSPQRLKMQGFHLHYDHGDVYNFAKEWFRIKSINKDSVLMQRLFVNNKEIADDIRSDVNLTYYSEGYIKNTLKTTAEILQRPSSRDTAFIRALSAKANRNPQHRDSVYAGRNPVVFIPRSKLISVEKLSSVDVLNGKTEAYDYLYPSYRMVIQKAYKDFGYSFTVLVDAQGKMTLGTFTGAIPEYREVRKKVLKGIIEVYLQNMLEVKPGSTLGIAHASEISVTVKGIKG